ncbi:MAG TPA: endo-1,4-beta-xylanase, partial [Terriglobales bacterium]|nr:endo-1,4-beta-xylanase [Terriglobales bacterium]
MTKSRHAIFAFVVALLLGCVGQGETLPPTFFGMHVNQSKTAWPSVGFGSYRLWDDGTAWANLNPSNGSYNWAPLDAWVNRAQQQNVQLLYTFGRTPAWASSNTSISCNYGGGQCVAPANYAYWDAYVTALVTRYKGKIKYYELWNEPNDPGFWKGTTAQMVEMTRRASQII